MSKPTIDKLLAKYPADQDTYAYQAQSQCDAQDLAAEVRRLRASLEHQNDKQLLRLAYQSRWKFPITAAVPPVLVVKPEPEPLEERCGALFRRGFLAAYDTPPVHARCSRVRGHDGEHMYVEALAIPADLTKLDTMSMVDLGRIYDNRAMILDRHARTSVINAYKRRLDKSMSNAREASVPVLVVKPEPGGRMAERHAYTPVSSDTCGFRQLDDGSWWQCLRIHGHGGPCAAHTCAQPSERQNVLEGCARRAIADLNAGAVASAETMHRLSTLVRKYVGAAMPTPEPPVIDALQNAEDKAARRIRFEWVTDHVLGVIVPC